MYQCWYALHLAEALQQVKNTLHGIFANLKPKAWLYSWIGPVKIITTGKKTATNNKREFEGRFFTTKKQVDPTATKSTKKEKRMGGFFSLITGDRGTYTDLPPFAIALNGIAVCVLLRAYFEKHLSFFWLILLIVFTTIPSFLSLLIDVRKES